MAAALLLVALLSLEIYHVSSQNSESAVLSVFQKVTQSTARILHFYSKNYDSVNLDAIFGLRCLQGQLQLLLDERADGKHQHWSEKEFEIISTLQGDAKHYADKSIPYLRTVDPKYFTRMAYVILHPWMLFREHRLVDESLVWTSGEIENGAFVAQSYTEEKSDVCMSELQGTERVDQVPCVVSKECVEMNLTPGQSSYIQQHQVLYILLAQKMKCSEQIMQIRKESGLGMIDLGAFLHRLCSNVYLQMMSKLHQFDYNVPEIHQDLILEELAICPQLGYMQFMTTATLKLVVGWQTSSGCYGRLLESEDGKELDNNYNVHNNNDLEQAAAPNQQPPLQHQQPVQQNHLLQADPHKQPLLQGQQPQLPDQHPLQPNQPLQVDVHQKHLLHGQDQHIQHTLLHDKFKQQEQPFSWDQQEHHAQAKQQQLLHAQSQQRDQEKSMLGSYQKDRQLQVPQQQQAGDLQHQQEVDELRQQVVDEPRQHFRQSYIQEQYKGRAADAQEAREIVQDEEPPKQQQLILQNNLHYQNSYHQRHQERLMQQQEERDSMRISNGKSRHYQSKAGYQPLEFHPSPIEHSKLAAGNSRSLLAELEVDGGCLSHKSAVAVAALGNFIRYIIDPGPARFAKFFLMQPQVVRDAVKLYEDPSHVDHQQDIHDELDDPAHESLQKRDDGEEEVKNAAEKHHNQLEENAVIPLPQGHEDDEDEAVPDRGARDEGKREEEGHGILPHPNNLQHLQFEPAAPADNSYHNIPHEDEEHVVIQAADMAEGAMHGHAKAADQDDDQEELVDDDQAVHQGPGVGPGMQPELEKDEKWRAVYPEHDVIEKLQKNRKRGQFAAAQHDYDHTQRTFMSWKVLGLSLFGAIAVCYFYKSFRKKRFGLSRLYRHI